MATAVKVGDAASVGLTAQAGKSFYLSQSSRPSKLQNVPGWRHLQGNGNGTGVLSTKLAFGKPLLKVTRIGPFKPAALPLGRKSVKDGSESGAEELNSEPWLGAIVFKRNAVRSHYEFHTSLERLGLGFLSTDSSRTLANLMGLNSASVHTSTEESTPVNISIDVSRDEETRDLRLDGLARTTVSLCCNRCLSPVVERIFASFNLLLTENPVIEPTQQRLGVVLGGNGPENDDPELDLDLDDKLHFPRESREIDLSKYLRDSVHLEIPYKSLCSVQCAGLCPTCGVNLNERTCDCPDVVVKPSWGPLEQLRRQLKDQEGGLQ